MQINLSISFLLHLVLRSSLKHQAKKNSFCFSLQVRSHVAATELILQNLNFQASKCFTKIIASI